MSIPAKPYRCPPGPYERACVVADWLKRNRPGSKVIVLDANPGITAEMHSFTEGFAAARTIEYQPNTTVISVDATTMTVQTNSGNVRGNVLNVIPPQRAGKVITANGLADAGGKLDQRQCAVLRGQGRAGHPCHRRRVGDDPAQGRPHRQPGSQGLRRRHPAPVLRPRARSVAAHQLGLLLADHLRDRLLAHRQLRLRPGHADHAAGAGRPRARRRHARRTTSRR